MFGVQSIRFLLNSDHYCIWALHHLKSGPEFFQEELIPVSSYLFVESLPPKNVRFFQLGYKFPPYNTGYEITGKHRRCIPPIRCWPQINPPRLHKEQYDSKEDKNMRIIRPGPFLTKDSAVWTIKYHQIFADEISLEVMPCTAYHGYISDLFVTSKTQCHFASCYFLKVVSFAGADNIVATRGISHILPRPNTHANISSKIGCHKARSISPSLPARHFLST